ncbi:hypothetical protein DKM44_03410 [Deinococcus irradiatisoli]|uniref:Uncharacterized protein n=1 Tax=Deinococcus irradiatisoli TaxID=2202254 RepID=A0A2Z3JKF1_9DEIO|nr:hypothetical protein DKM44_03410 [Deinococcus irradiatisoli]
MASSPVGLIAQSDWRSKLAPLLPQSGQLAQVMETRPKFSMTEVRRRVMDVGGDQQVLQQMLSSAERGVAPQYDKRVKISEADFQRYLVIQQELQPNGKIVRLSVTRSSTQLTFGDAGGTALLRGIILDLVNGDMRFPEGFSAKPEALVITAAQAQAADDPLGPRSGYVWKVRGSNPTTQTALNGHFALLALSDGSVLISYNRNGILRGAVGTGNLILSFSRDGAAITSRER